MNKELLYCLEVFGLYFLWIIFLDVSGYIGTVSFDPFQLIGLTFIYLIYEEIKDE